MSFFGLTVIDVLAVCLGVALAVALMIIILNCFVTCWNVFFHRPAEKCDVERLPDDYIEEIRRLLEQHRKVVDEYDCVFDEDRPISSASRVDKSTFVTMRSRTSSGRHSRQNETLKTPVNSKESLNNEEAIEEKRRTWTGLTDSQFEPIGPIAMYT
ncbi:unnamed protein product [Caenorhabditis auriculariae]|uniref:Uncharacterized protein n=1 Tax=Caenorhabditis auriculariae TaxID=2777116 RepID=A0A8S1HTU5_9PELO|nr:unnamed protein product [Caenorhabditis auriculariae]